jgi:uncharacterized protein
MSKHGRAVTGTFSRPEGIKVEVRRMRFPFEERGFDRYWLDGSPFKSLFWTQLSTSFDAGERFFIDSARALKDHIKEPALHEEMVEFCKQEGHHTFQHLKFDRMNAAMGIDVAGCERRFRWLLNRVRKRYSPISMLAVTVALEHFTAGLASELLTNEHMSAGADPNVYVLWQWHAVEESEHKATCFEIYEAAGGGYLRRVLLMPLAWLLITALSLFNTAVLLKNDKKLFTRDTLSGLAYLFGRHGVLTRMVPTFFSFFKPNFHPWQEDNSQAVRDWHAQNPQFRDTSREVRPHTAVTAPALSVA